MTKIGRLLRHLLGVCREVKIVHTPTEDPRVYATTLIDLTFPVIRFCIPTDHPEYVDTYRQELLHVKFIPTENQIGAILRRAGYGYMEADRKSNDMIHILISLMEAYLDHIKETQRPIP